MRKCILWCDLREAGEDGERGGEKGGKGKQKRNGRGRNLFIIYNDIV